MVQITLITIDNYGPWTHTLGNDREHKLQMYQASLFETIQNMFSVRGGLVFSNRLDEFFAITDGISYHAHLEIKTKLQELFPFEISMSIANSKYPYLANKEAFMAQRALNCKNSISAAVKKDSSSCGVNLIHLDIEGTTKMRKKMTPYDITMLVQATHQIISHYCYENKLLGFFVGGDNFVVVSDDDAKRHSENISSLIQKNMQIVVNCGIGEEQTARIAMAMATKNLDEIRKLRKLGCNFPRILDNRTAINQYNGLSVNH